MPRVVEYFGQSLKAALSRKINTVTFANLGSVRLPNLKFVGFRVCKIRRIQCVSCLSTTVSQSFEPQWKKLSFLRTPAFIFCLPWGCPCGNHAKRCTNEKTIQCLPNPSQHVQIYLQHFPSYSNRKCKKSPSSRTAAHIFVSLWRRPCDYHAICCMDGKTIQCLPNPSQHVPIYLQQFPSYTMLKSMRKSKNCYFYHIFVSPRDAPEAITLNVVWMEREFDAYKLSSCKVPSNYNRL